MTMLDLRCPTCATPVPFEDVNLARMLGKCTPCKSVFEFADGTGTPAAPGAPRGVPPKPDHVTIEGAIDESPIPTDYRSYGARTAAPLALRWRWFKVGGLFTLFFAIAWNGFLLVFYSALAKGDAPIFAWLFPIAHVAVGVAVAKEALSNLLNRTEIAVDGAELRASFGPIRWPWQRAVTIPVAELRQLSTLEKSVGKNGLRHDVIAHLADGSSRALIENVGDSQLAAYVERAVEQHLGLPDEPWRNARV